MDWEIAKWALRGSGSTAFTDLINIDGVRESLNLLYGTSVQLNKFIDEKLPGRPKFTRSEVVVNGEVFHLYSRDILECVRARWGDTDFTPTTIDKGKTIRMYQNMHTGKWWWSTQDAVERDNPGATIIPIIISSDKTQLMVFGNKMAYIYPVYMTIGNIPKEIRQQVGARRRILSNVFHAYMAHILAPLKDAGITGIPMMSGDGVTLSTGECPTCEAPRDMLGEDSDFPLRDLRPFLQPLNLSTRGPTIYARACEEVGIKPVYHPFWAIGPDILHQLYHGQCCGEAEIDAWCRRLPPNHNIISNLSRVTGKEHNQIRAFCSVSSLMSSCRTATPPPNSLLAVRSLLDFIYLAQYPMRTSETLDYLDNALQRFHDNKSIFSTERLHIDLAKDAYRSTNFKDEFPQMILWLERKEKIYRHDKYIQWQLNGCPAPPHPSLKSVRLSKLTTDQGATFFRDALARFVVHLNHPELSRTQVEARSQDLSFPFNTVPVFHRIKFTTEDPYTARGPEDTIVDSIHGLPGRTELVLRTWNRTRSQDNPAEGLQNCTRYNSPFPSKSVPRPFPHARPSNFGIGFMKVNVRISMYSISQASTLA
ncbi:hypothetical protein B0H14DRAFT_3110180 [Mycena olivaceomarginata]|nr:hypothetical protein B0H14DRAFT_3110180 [Mycena olivaceomarginata]